MAPGACVRRLMTRLFVNVQSLRVRAGRLYYLGFNLEEAVTEFLLDLPGRLTVTFSCAKLRIILVGSRCVFSTDEGNFADAQLWKYLLRHTVVKGWESLRARHTIIIW